MYGTTLVEMKVQHLYYYHCVLLEDQCTIYPTSSSKNMNLILQHVPANDRFRESKRDDFYVLMILNGLSHELE
jgi:hypothetical protein